MSNFLYWTERAENAVEARALLERLGMTHVLDWGGPVVAKCIGPSGNEGLLIVPSCPNGPPPVFNAEQQTWASYENGDIWCGYENANKPTPEHLECRGLAEWWNVQLGDGNTWKIATAKGLPGKLGRRESSGLWEKQIGPEWRALYDWTVEFNTRIANGEEVTETQSDLVNRCCDVLRVNYRIGWMEIDALGLIEEEHLMPIIRGICDRALIERVKEKNLTGDGQSPSG